MYHARHYRKTLRADDLVRFQVGVGETDLLILAESDLSDAAGEAIREVRGDIERHIDTHPDFATSLAPVSAQPDTPEIVRTMCGAGKKAGVGPMAAVAGAVAEAVGQRLLEFTGQVIIENGGDIFLNTLAARTVSIYAGTSRLSGRLGLQIPAGSTVGICTSSATVGHSHSSGRADSAVVVAEDTAVADAVATAMGNRVKAPNDVEEALHWAREIDDVIHAAIVIDDTFGTIGQLKIVRT